MEKATLASKYLTFGEESKKLLAPRIVELLIDTFDKVYPGICDFFNNGEIREVVFEADPDFDSPPALIIVSVTTTVDDDETGEIISESTEITENNKIKFNPNDKICQEETKDIDWITHELVHVAQNYRNVNCPSWICEGLADYGRGKYGLHDKESGWKIWKGISNEKTYEIGYTIATGFFIWIEQNIDKTFSKDLNNTIKLGKYNDNYFVEKTGKPVDELWQIYVDENRANFIVWLEKYIDAPLPIDIRNKIKLGEFDDELDNYIIEKTGKSIDDLADLCMYW